MKQCVVTGASGYTGRYVTRFLLDDGVSVKSLTGHPDRADPFDGRVEYIPYRFDDPDALARSLEGADVLVNTYWVRSERGSLTHDVAARNLAMLFESARRAGVERVVHVSIANASSESPLSYFRGKGLAEEALMASGVSYAILRPTVIFGREDVLINNIAWTLRRFPVFLVPGDGRYRIQPIYVLDLARVVVDMVRSPEDRVFDVAGPDTFTFLDLLKVVSKGVGVSRRLVCVPPDIALAASGMVGLFKRDMMLTRAEVQGLSANLLISGENPRGWTRLEEWLASAGGNVGLVYASEMDRHYR